MATAFLRPNSDNVQEWTVSPSGTAWAALDDDVEQPTAPDTDNFISTTGQNKVARVGLTTVDVESVSAATVWGYVSNTAILDTDWFITVRLADQTVLATIRVQEDTAAQWQSAAVPQATAEALTQADVDGLVLNYASGNGEATHTRRCDAAYVELVYVPASAAQDIDRKSVV